MRIPTLLIAIWCVFALAVGCTEDEKEKTAAAEDAVDAGVAEPEEAALEKIAEAEPNERTLQAQEIKSACVVDAELEAAAGPKKRAVDWYKIVPPSRKVLSIEVPAIADEDVTLIFMDADRNKLFRVDSTGPGEAERYPNLTTERGVYMQVRGSEGGKGGAYNLSIRMSDPEDGFETEYNGRYSAADDLNVGEQVKGYLAHERDEDWYLLSLSDLATGSVLRTDVSPVQGVRFALEVLGFEERVPIMKTSSEKKSEGILVRNLGLPAGADKLYVVIKSSWVREPGSKKAVRTYNPKDFYSLSVSSETGGDDLEREPNDSAEDAMQVLDGQKVRGYLANPSDVDWYKIEVERPSLLSAELSALDRLDLQLYVVDPEKKDQARDFELLRINDGEVNEPETLTNCALQPGTNYVRVEQAWKKVDNKWVRDTANVDETYSLTLNLRTDEGKEEREPNRKPEWATPIAPGQTLRGTLHPKGDVDTYRLDLSDQDGPITTEIECTGIPKLDVAIALLGPEKDEKGNLKKIDASAKGEGEAKELIRKELMPGEYHIVVRGRPRSKSNTRDQYLLTVTQ